MSEFLLELFSEEIPARFQKQAAEDLHRLVTDKLTAMGLTFTKAEAHVTPRRLALVVDGLPTAQPDRSEEKKGPKEDAPQAAIDGFLKSAGVTSLEACELRDTPKGKVWFAVSHIKGRPTVEVLAGVIKETLHEMPWKKSMTWGSTAFRWVRPLKTILAIFDGKLIDGLFELGGEQAPIPFTDHAQGHRFLGEGSFKVTSFADYQQKLNDQGVILSRDARKAIIKTEAEKLLADKGLELTPDEALLEEVCGLVEWPVPMLGKIDDAFMTIPPEVLITSMRVNQKYFVANTKDGKMAPYFIVTANIPGDQGSAVIVDGNQRVLRARLSDAQFFWETDKATTLAARVPQLDSITFHAKLGTVAQKVARMGQLAAALNIPNAAASDVATAAQLAKTDLVTGMVGEFPELQGIMGGYYARHDGHSNAIATAITEHYSPIGPTDKCPSAPVSVAVAMSDKLDTLVGFFGIDEKPTGSKDPYALRRAALGVLRLVLENGLKLDLMQAMKAAYALYPAGLLRAEADTLADLAAFFIDRLKVMLKDKGYRHDVIAAVITPEALSDVSRARALLEAVQPALSTPEGVALIALYKRASNILKIEEKKDGKTYTEASPISHLTEGSEKTLQAATEAAVPSVQAQLAKADFAGAMQSLTALRVPLDAFFEAVVVNAPEADVRASRLALLAKVRAALHLMADFSQISGE